MLSETKSEKIRGTAQVAESSIPWVQSLVPKLNKMKQRKQNKWTRKAFI
jgi:hypothetical protein